MSNLKHSNENEEGHCFDYQCLKIFLKEVNGNDIGSEGGIRFTMCYKETINGKETLTKVDEFVIYPDAIDWKNGGQMKPEFQKRIKELHENEAENPKEGQMPVTAPAEETEETEGAEEE